MATLRTTAEKAVAEQGRRKALAGYKSLGQGGGTGSAGPRQRSLHVPLAPAPEQAQMADMGGPGDSSEAMARAMANSPQPGERNENSSPRQYAQATAPEKSGFDRYFESVTARSPRQAGGKHIGRGAVYTSGPFKGRTKDQAYEISRRQYAAMGDKQKERWERMDSGEDLLSRKETANRAATANARNTLAAGNDAAARAAATPPATSPVPPAASPASGTGEPPTQPAPQSQPPKPFRAPSATILGHRGSINGQDTATALGEPVRPALDPTGSDIVRNGTATPPRGIAKVSPQGQADNVEALNKPETGSPLREAAAGARNPMVDRDYAAKFKADKRAEVLAAQAARIDALGDMGDLPMAPGSDVNPIVDALTYGRASVMAQARHARDIQGFMDASNRALMARNPETMKEAPYGPSGEEGKTTMAVGKSGRLEPTTAKPGDVTRNEAGYLRTMAAQAKKKAAADRVAQNGRKTTRYTGTN